MDLDVGLIGHWKLTRDCTDASGHRRHGRNLGVTFAGVGPEASALFNGRNGHVEVPRSGLPGLGGSNFAVSVWVHTEALLDDIIGDVASLYDPVRRRGFTLSIDNRAGVTSSQSNWRNVSFGIDDGRIDEGWSDCGRPGNAVNIGTFAVYEGHLYAGTFETGEHERGHAWRYEGGTEWSDCGSPDASNSVWALALYNGQLYAGTARYRAEGSALPPSLNQNPGGRVYRYEGGQTWRDCGRLGEANEVKALTVYKGELYAIPLYSGGMFRYDGDRTWHYCGIPGGKRAMALGVHNGGLYSAGNEVAGIWRYLGGTDWENCGQRDDVHQVYSFATYRSDLYFGTWPKATVYRYAGGTEWTDCGRLGEELEVMAMVVYNGKLYAGTLPLAQVYRYDGNRTWTLVGRLDWTEGVKYRRAWSMALYDGRLFAGTLPSGHALSLSAGACVTYDRELEPGWRHLVALKQGDRLRIFVDGAKVATSASFDPARYDLSAEAPLAIGFGPQDVFNGRMRDFRLYNRALTDQEIGELSSR